jgi:hypothetical protein
VSQIHRRVWIDTRTGRQACPPYDPRYVRADVFEFSPSDRLRLFAQAGMPRRRPSAPVDCQHDDGAGIAPQITSPVLGAAYTVRTTVAEQSRVPLVANADREVQRALVRRQGLPGNQRAGHGARLDPGTFRTVCSAGWGRSRPRRQPSGEGGVGAVGCFHSPFDTFRANDMG